MDLSVKVLIVEADHTSASKLKAIIEQEGYQYISIATDGMAALQALNNINFDLAIVDSEMPNSWSETVLHALNKKGTNAQVIFLGLPDPEQVQKLTIRYPGTFFLARPFTNTDLVTTATDAINNRPAVVSVAI